MLLALPMMSAKTFEDYEQEITLEVRFKEIVDCQEEEPGAGENIIVVEVEGDKYVTYTFNCDDDIVEAKYSDSIVEHDNDHDDENVALDQEWREANDDWDKIDFKTEFDIDLTEDEEKDLCGEFEVDYGVWDELRGNLSFCYNTMQTLVGLEAQCIDNAEFAGEYRQKYDSCKADYDECSVTLSSTSDERTSFDEEASSCESDLDNCNDARGRCEADKSQCNIDLGVFEKKAGQNIVYGIVGFILGIIAMNIYIKQKGGSASHSSDERELYD